MSVHVCISRIHQVYWCVIGEDVVVDPVNVLRSMWVSFHVAEIMD
jgi:hypothetical protein